MLLTSDPSLYDNDLILEDENESKESMKNLSPVKSDGFSKDSKEDEFFYDNPKGDEVQI